MDTLPKLEVPTGATVAAAADKAAQTRMLKLVMLALGGYMLATYLAERQYANAR